MARLATDVHVKDPKTRLMVHLRAGEEPAPEYAELVTNPDAWEGGKLPTAAKSQADSSDEDDAEDDKPAAKRAARKPARTPLVAAGALSGGVPAPGRLAGRALGGRLVVLGVVVLVGG